VAAGNQALRNEDGRIETVNWVPRALTGGWRCQRSASKGLEADANACKFQRECRVAIVRDLSPIILPSTRRCLPK
jgi:hypothetical protein